jgi:hypothetical protein
MSKQHKTARMGYTGLCKPKPTFSPAGKLNWTTKDGKPSDAPKQRVHCPDCGWKGHVHQLLICDDDTLFYCPECHSIGWLFT